MPSLSIKAALIGLSLLSGVAAWALFAESRGPAVTVADLEAEQREKEKLRRELEEGRKELERLNRELETQRRGVRVQLREPETGEYVWCTYLDSGVLRCD